MQKTYVCVAGVVQFGSKVLLLKRTSTRRASADKWQPPSGFIKEKEAVEDAVLREVKEETGLDGEIIGVGNFFEAVDEWGKWVTMPFLISVKSDNVVIDQKEHSEAIWIEPKDVLNFDLVEGSRGDFEALGLL